jgi:formylglycine-generating enzyme required for sulfatase activity
MIEIPAGEIVLRDDRIQKEWNVEIRPFFLNQFPVTQEEYFVVTGKSPSTFKGNRNPVENVSWYDAILFCNMLSRQDGFSQCYSVGDGEKVSCNPDAHGYRLPSEAEWEYACRAGTSKVVYGEIDEIAWYRGNSNGTTHEVGTKQPNAWGLFDMLGNVWEWCWDIYDEATYGPYRVFRGGGWNDPARGCLASNRRRSHPTFFIDDLGFRIARNICGMAI